MRFACALSTHEEVGGLVRELETPVLATLDEAPDLAVLFVQGSLADVAGGAVAAGAAGCYVRERHRRKSRG
jgi:hypothetical protein